MILNPVVVYDNTLSQDYLLNSLAIYYLTMPKLFDPKVDTQIKTLSKEKNSYRSIQKKLLDDNIEVSIGHISNVLAGMGIRREALDQGREIPKKPHTPVKRTPSVIQKVKSLVDKEDPPTYDQMMSKFNVSRPTLSKIIHKDLKLQKRKKPKVHRLTTNARKNRKTNCRKLYENHLAGNRSEFAVTLDEALVYQQDSNKSRDICYLEASESLPESWVFEKGESFQQGFMVIGVITGRGAVPLFRVPSRVKINAQYYIDYVLKPLFEEHLPRLYGNDIDKVFFHHDKATSHTAKITTDYLERQKRERGIDYIKPEDIPVKAPDASPLDFFGFGYLKQELAKKRARTLDGVWKLSKRVWSQIDEPTIERVFAAWKRRCRMISRQDGAHVEQTKNIHRRRAGKIF